MKKYLLLTSILLLNACAMLPDWLGEGEDKPLEGERVTILKTESAIEADKAIADVMVTLPELQTNTRWYKSSGFHVLTWANPVAPESFTSIETADAGSAGKPFHLSASPVVADNKIFTLDGNGVVSAFSVNNIKELIWQKKVAIKKHKGDFANGGLTYENGRLYLTTGNSLVVALDAENGNEIWQRILSTVSRSAPEARGNHVYINSINNSLYALDAENGSIVWTHAGLQEDVETLGNGSPIAQEGRVIVPYSSGEIYALKPGDGTEIWSDSLANLLNAGSYTLSDIDASPIVDGNLVYAMSTSGTITATQLETGIPVWEQQNIASSATPWIAGGFIYVTTTDKQVVAIHAESGSIKWVVALPAWEDEEDKEDPIFWTAPVLAGNRLLVVGSDGKLLSLSPQDGKIIDEYKVPGDIYISPVVAYDTVFLFSNNAKLIALKGPLSQGTLPKMAVEIKTAPTLEVSKDAAGVKEEAAPENKTEEKHSFPNPFKGIKEKLFGKK